MSEAHWPSGQLPKALFDNSQAAMVTVSIDGMVIAANASFAMLVERPVNVLLDGEFVDLLHADDRAAYTQLLQSILTGESAGDQTTLRFEHGSGVFAEGHASISLIQDPILEQEFFFIVIQDASEERRDHRRLVHQASHDDLTGLINRREFIERLARALDSCQLYGVSHTLCYIDLDDFKPINDMAGHDAGDRLLVELTLMMSQTVRARDTVARLGGDEFALLLENCPIDEGEKIASKLCDRLSTYAFDVEGCKFKVGASLGVVAITIESQSVSDVMQLADMACYAAKDLGKNQVHVYRSQSVAEPQASVLRLEDWMTAFSEQRFQLAAQPIISLQESNVNAPQNWSEILLRIVDDKGQHVSPRLVIPVSERYGKMAQIDRWVIGQSIRYCARQDMQGLSPMLSINLSATSLADDKLCVFIAQQLSEQNVNASQLCFEITETAAVRNIELARLLVGRIKEFGCKIALDDFGAGVSSLRYLDELHVDYLKIDSHFVRKLANNNSSSTMVNAIQQLSSALGLETVAEEVESESVGKMLEKLGVTYGQGYYYGRPEIIDKL